MSGSPLRVRAFESGHVGRHSLRAQAKPTAETRPVAFSIRPLVLQEATEELRRGVLRSRRFPTRCHLAGASLEMTRAPQALPPLPLLTPVEVQQPFPGSLFRRPS